MPNWLSGVVCEASESLVVRSVEPSFPPWGFQVGKGGSHAAIIGAGDRKQETVWCLLTLIGTVSCPVCDRERKGFIIKSCYIVAEWLLQTLLRGKSLEWNRACECCCMEKSQFVLFMGFEKDAGNTVYSMGLVVILLLRSVVIFFLIIIDFIWKALLPMVARRGEGTERERDEEDLRHLNLRHLI